MFPVSVRSLGKHQCSKVILQSPQVVGNPWLTDIGFLTLLVFQFLRSYLGAFSWVFSVLHVPRVNKGLFYMSCIIVVLLKSLTRALSATIATGSCSFSNCIFCVRGGWTKLVGESGFLNQSNKTMTKSWSLGEKMDSFQGKDYFDTFWKTAFKNLDNNLWLANFAFTKHWDRRPRTIALQAVLGSISRSSVADECQSDPKGLFTSWQHRLWLLLGHRVNTRNLRKTGSNCPFLTALLLSILKSPYLVDAWVSDLPA